MLLKHIRTCYSDRYSYCVGRVLWNYVKSTEALFSNLRNASQVNLFFSTNVQETPSEISTSKRENRKKIKDTSIVPAKKKTIAGEFEEFFAQKTNLYQIRDLIPKKFISRRRKTDDSLYLVDSDVADQVIETIQPHIVEDDCYVIEANPGLGLLSERLVNIGVQNLHLFEASSSFLPCLKILKSVHPDKISLRLTDMFSIYKLAYQDKMDNGSRVPEVLSPFPQQDWSADPVLKIVGANGLMMWGRPELYLIIPPSIYLVLTSLPEDGNWCYRSLSVFFQLFFDCNLLDKVPRKAFLPWSLKPQRKTNRNHKDFQMQLLDEQMLYLVKVVPKKNLYTEVANPDKLQPFWFFVRQNMISRKCRVVPKLESWIPNCGIRLILEGFSIFTEFGALNPHEILNVFNQFTKWPEYQDSSFLTSMEVALMKMEESADESIDKSGDAEEEKKMVVRKKRAS